jgi:hypothetical protein
MYGELYGTGNDKGERYWNLPDASHIVVSFSFVTGRRRRDNKCERGRKEEVEVEIKCVALLCLPLYQPRWAGLPTQVKPGKPLI